MGCKECFEKICGYSKGRVVVEEGYVSDDFGDIEYRYSIIANGVASVSTAGFQDVFNKWREESPALRERQIAELKKQLKSLESYGEVEA